MKASRLSDAQGVHPMESGAVVKPVIVLKDAAQGPATPPNCSGG